MLGIWILIHFKVAIGPAVCSYSVTLGLGLRSGLGLSKSLFPVGTTGDQRLPAGPIATR